MGLAAPGFENPRKPPGIRLPVDRTVGIDVHAADARPRAAAIRARASPARRRGESSGRGPRAHDRAAYLSAQAALQKYRVAGPLPRVMALRRGM